MIILRIFTYNLKQTPMETQSELVKPATKEGRRKVAYREAAKKQISYALKAIKEGVFLF